MAVKGGGPIHKGDLQQHFDGLYAVIGTTTEFVEATVAQLHVFRTSLEAADRSVQEIAEALEESQKNAASLWEMADETQLLALNATITAYRVQQAGHVVDVIASAVLDLSREIEEAAQQMGGLLQKMRSTTTRMRKELAEVGGLISEDLLPRMRRLRTGLDEFEALRKEWRHLATVQEHKPGDEPEEGRERVNEIVEEMQRRVAQTLHFLDRVDHALAQTAEQLSVFPRAGAELQDQGAQIQRAAEKSRIAAQDLRLLALRIAIEAAQDETKRFSSLAETFHQRADEAYTMMRQLQAAVETLTRRNGQVSREMKYLLQGLSRTQQQTQETARTLPPFQEAIEALLQTYAAESVATG
ncbi:MAG: methyl-accepting chemotaxis protein [Firmicutes bacterium]|nr:methyl-accepting chemotaxis protein [Bacillota bacterium]